MRYGIFADIHSNQEAFENVIKSYKKENIDCYLCVGDIVGYGADPHWCISQIQRLNIKSVCGNHDWASSGIIEPDYFNPAAREAVFWTRRNLDAMESGFLSTLPLIIEEDDFYVVHGSLYNPEAFDYITDIESSYKCFLKMQRSLCFIGHSHIPIVFYMEHDEIKSSFDNFIKFESELKYIVNVGSVGQPRDGNTLATFSIYDSDRETVEIKRVAYDIESARKKILEAGLPRILGDRLLEGR